MTTDFTMSPPPGYANWQGTPTPPKQNGFQGFLSSFGGSLKSAFPSMAIGAASSLAGSLINNMFARKNARMQYDYQRKLMDYQQKLQYQLLANEMPMKMQSYRNAGLSTAALAGQFGGNVSVPGGSAGMPSASPANVGDVSVTDLLQARMFGLDMKEKEANINLINQEAQKTKAEENAININAGLEGVYGASQREASLSEIKQNIRTALSTQQKNDQDRLNSMRLTDSQVKSIEETLDINWKSLSIQGKVAAANAYQAYATGKLQYEEAKLVGEKVKTEGEIRNQIQTKMLVDIATANDLFKKAALYAPQIKMLEAQGRSAEAQALRDEYRADVETSVPKWLKITEDQLDWLFEKGLQGTQIYGNVMTGGATTMFQQTTGPKGTTTTETRKSYQPVWQQ